MYKGRVKFYLCRRGFGFIVLDNGEEIFVHYSRINSNDKYKNLEKGQVVTFDITDTEKGRQAINITLITEN